MEARKGGMRRRQSAPCLQLASLDFERVVNSYSISATRNRCANYNRNTDVECCEYHESRDSEAAPLFSPSSKTNESYETFSSQNKKEPHRQSQNNEGDEELRDQNDSNMRKNSKYIFGNSGRTMLRWVLTFLVGLLTGIVAVLIVKSTDTIVQFREAGLNRLEKSVTSNLWGHDHLEGVAMNTTTLSKNIPKPVNTWWKV